MIEVWKPIINYEGQYEISSFGRVKSLPRTNGTFRLSKEKMLHIKLNRGYSYVTLCKNNKLRTFTVHRLVAVAFIPNQDNKAEINHKNGIKTDNRIENLEWATSSENKIHRIEVLKIYNKKGKEDKRSKIILQTKNNEIIGMYYGFREAQNKTGIDNASIWRCCNNKQNTAGGYCWKYGEKNEL